MIAGAIISGAYFGDKISPLSDTTVMAASISGSPLFKHIKYLMLTTVPSFVLTLTIFLVLGFLHTGNDSAQISVYTETLSSKFNISLWTLIVPVVTGILIAKKCLLCRYWEYQCYWQQAAPSFSSRTS